MNTDELISILKKIDKVKSVTGITYRIDSVNERYIVGTRLSTDNEFKIETAGLLKAYNDITAGKIPMTTTALRAYVNMVQSPTLAIIMAIRGL